ncbi:hypothetical protein [Streptomyces sp. Z26]|uniref:hypothetical protein n=1 Tax=Streptomyces sp. Z26 TaxID=2500177 RepID=UPI000EF14105|nr:hypothetical protein [Streptomyces sp. Z26]RLL69350.1 hypothetical protein D7M15_23760 [Streptomyces sp. Z26]
MSVCPKCGREEAAFGGWKCGYCAGRELGDAYHAGGMPEVERVAEQKRSGGGGGSGCLLALFTGGALTAAAGMATEVARHWG